MCQVNAWDYSTLGHVNDVNPALGMVTAFAFADEQVIKKLQSSVKAEKLCWVSELLIELLRLSTPWAVEGD